MREQDLQHHIQLKRGDVGRYVLLPGDPERCDKIASYFDYPHLMAYNREYKTYTGTLLGEKVSVTSTGIGGPSAAIAVEELVAIGADTFIRVGTSGGMQPETIPGEIAVVTAAIRDEGTSLHYLPVEFPAVADTDVVLAMIEGAKRAGMSYRVGICQTKDSYYGEVEPERMPIANQLIERWDAWVAGGAICSEMESSAIFILSSIHHVRAGGVMLMSFSEDNIPQTEEEWQRFEEMFNIERVIQTAIEGLKVLIERDHKK